MKLDLHCHIREGSIDAKVSLAEYISELKKNKIDGMLITDHDTYNGYRFWKNTMQGKMNQDFLVLKGIEYDTRDAGHMLIIMPEGVKMQLLELRGLSAVAVINFVHRHGGIIGPAHPCGEKYLSFTNTKTYYSTPELMEKFDFFEVFNSCETEESNENARKLAEKYKKIGTGGSDAHRIDCVGKGYTEFSEKITCETELIAAIRNGKIINATGELYKRTTKDKIGRVHKVLVYSFWVYNKWGTLIKGRKRKKKNKIENPVYPIDPIEALQVRKSRK